MNLEIKGTVIKTQTEDGYELDAVLVEPEKKTDVVVIHFHGKEGDFLENHFISVMANYYTENGISFMTASHRGKSYIADILRKSALGYEYTQMGSAFDIFENCIYDIDSWVNVMIKRGYKDIYLQQHSTPQKILWYYFNKHPKNIRGLILISPADIAYAFEEYVPDYIENLSLAKKMVGVGKGKDLMPVNLWSNCPVSADTFVNWGDPQSNIQVFNYKHPDRGFKYFSEIKAPMLAVLGDNDFSVGNPAKECLSLLEKHCVSDKLKTKLIQDANHSFQGKEELLARIITDWVLKNNND